MKKKEKIVKVLSDGTVAKVGMIITLTRSSTFYKEGNVRRIRAVVNKNITNKLGVIFDLSKSNDVIMLEDWGLSTSIMRKATPEERKQYYKDLYARIDQ